MADPKELAIMKRLCEIIEGVNPDNLDPGDTDDESYTPVPYDVDLRGKVVRGRTVFGAETSAPFISVLESPEPLAPVGVGYAKTTRKELWQLLVQGFVADDKQNPTDPAYVLKAKVTQRLARIIQVDKRTDNPVYPTDYLLDGLIISLTIGQGVVRPPDGKVSSSAFFYIPLVVELSTDVTNPYGS